MFQKKFLLGTSLLILVNSFLRAFLEFFSNPEIGHVVSPWSTTLEYILFYAAMTFGLGIILGWITKRNLPDSILLMAKFLPIILIAPIIDLLVSHGNGICMAYLGTGGQLLVRDFFSFFGPMGQCGITPGLKIEIGMIIIGFAVITYLQTKSVIRSIVGSILTYIFIFLNAAIPGIIGLLGGSGIHAGQWLIGQIQNSLLGMIPVTDAVVLFMARFHYLCLLIFIGIVWLQDSQKTFVAWIKNGRFLRIAYYLFIAGLGGLLAFRTAGGSFHWIDIGTYLIASISIILHCWSAAVINDVNDISIDTISNTDRPLISNHINSSSYHYQGILFFILGCVGAFLVNYPFFLFLLVFQLLYLIYSIQEISLKKHFLSNGFVIGMNALMIAFAGYFLVTRDQSFTVSMLLYGFDLFLFIVIVSPVKDFKDIAGDSSAGIQTLPVVYGPQKSGIIVTILACLWTLVNFVIFKKLYFLGLMLGFIALYLFIMFKKDYSAQKREAILFSCFFIFIIILFLCI